MYKIQTLDKISPTGLNLFPRENYDVNSDMVNPDAILVRSSSLHNTVPQSNLQVVVRAGAGVNNIPYEQYGRLGIPVLNTPGANANAVKELVLAGMLMAARHLPQAWDYVRRLNGDDKALHSQIETNKKQFVGTELLGKTLGVIGLGNIGVKVANAASALGMRVIGYDTMITIKKAHALSPSVEESDSLEALIAQSDFITLHLPLNDDTKNLINAACLQMSKPGMTLLNFSRDGMVEKAALSRALDERHVAAYVSDFPCEQLKNHPNAIYFPHLGASTKEAEENCATMAVQQVRDYLENGTIIHSVNFPTVQLPPVESAKRLTIAHLNIQNMVAQISSKIGAAGLNIIDLLNKAHGEIAYTLLDVNDEISENLFKEIHAIEGVFKVRCL